MFCPVGFVTIAELWKEFCCKHELQLSAMARTKYAVEQVSLRQEFGSPMDFCEDAFLQSLRDTSVFSADDKGGIFRLESNLDGGKSLLFLRMSVFESTLAARNRKEAGINNYWLTKMGSGTFAPWPNTMGPSGAWREAYPVLDYHLKRVSAEPFHTLPVAFERSRFTIPEAPPPWAIDLLDEHYLPRIIRSFGGHALCLNTEHAVRWRAKYISNSNFLRKLEPSSGSTNSGRPRKQDEALTYYLQLFPNGHQGTLKVACQDIERTFGFVVAPKTLGRAIRTIEPKATETRK